MAVPSGYKKLDLVGYADKGTYSASATYNKNNVVYYNGSTYVALKDALVGVAPTSDNVNWKYMAKGFNAATASNMNAVDTSGITSSTNQGKPVVLQSLLDKLAAIAIKAVTSDTFQTQLKKRLVNNGTATQEGFALDARQGNPNVSGTLANQISSLNSQNNIKVSSALGTVRQEDYYCLLSNNKIINLTFRFQPTGTISTWKDFASIELKYAPKATISSLAIKEDGSGTFPFRINTNGTLSTENSSLNQTIYIHIVYII